MVTQKNSSSAGTPELNKHTMQPIVHHNGEIYEVVDIYYRKGNVTMVSVRLNEHDEIMTFSDNYTLEWVGRHEPMKEAVRAKIRENEEVMACLAIESMEAGYVVAKKYNEYSELKRINEVLQNLLVEVR